MLCKLVVFIYLGQALYMLRFMHFLVESVRLPNVEERHARILEIRVFTLDRMPLVYSRNESYSPV